MVEALTLEILVTAALLDSINPCVFGVLIFLLAYMTTAFKSKTKMLFSAFIYIISVYIAYFLAGMGIFTLVYTTNISHLFYMFAGGIAIVAGLLEIKDFFWYGKGFSLQLLPGGAERIKHYTKMLNSAEKKHPIFNVIIPFFLGILVVLVELPCTGAPYLVVLGLLSAGQYADGIPLLLLYNLIFILPLFVIVGAVYFGITSNALERWRKKHRGIMRLVVGLFLLALGVYMLLSVL